MMTLRIILCFIGLLTLNNTIACLNGDTKELKDGWTLFQDDDKTSDIPTGHRFYNFDKLDEEVLRLDSLYKLTKDVDYYSDKGLVLILLKRYDEAIKIYLEIERLFPNRYSTASNLGTTYELIGENELALKWIKKSLSIDKKSHDSSEWIHVKILEVKLKGETHINSQNLLGFDFGNVNEVKDLGLSKKELNEKAVAIRYQLQERMSFIKPKDKIVSLLLLNLGTIYYVQKRYFESLKVLESSFDYAELKIEKDVIENRKFWVFYELENDYKNLLAKNNLKNKQTEQLNMFPNSWTVLIILASIILGLVVFIIKLLYFRKTNYR